MSTEENAVFGSSYAGAYDTFYADKDYDAECDLVERVFRKHLTKPVQRILDLGCGTGGHAMPLARRGYTVVGIDRSEGMLQAARAKASGVESRVEFHRADLRDFELGVKFDAAIAMFAVIGYLPQNEDLLAALSRIRRHLAPGGLLVFDGWYGPGVLRERPTERVKTIEREGEQLIRIARPELDLVQQTVQVNYQVLRIKDRRVLDEARESHRMRFFFPQELSLLLLSTGFRMVALHPFGDLDRPIRETDWNFLTVAAPAAG